MSALTPSAAIAVRQSRLFSVGRSGVLLILVGHLIACVGVLVLMPGGWPAGSVQSVGYRIFPGVFVALLVAALLPLRRWRLEQIALALLLGLWIGFTGLVLVSFSVSGPRLALGAAVVVVVLAIALRSVMRGLSLQRVRTLALVHGAGIVLAIIPVKLLTAPPPSTHPMNIAMPKTVPASDVDRRMQRLDSMFALDPSQATVTVIAGRRYVYVEPVLSFAQRSPEGCWTIFAPKADRVPPARTLTSVSRGERELTVTYTDDATGGVVASDQLRVTHVDDRTVAIEAMTELPRPVWSHLNTFTQLTIAGHRRLRVRFSPMPEAVIDVTHAGYPFGSPSRFAYIDRGSSFHVVEASSAEKGPFHDLAAGPLNGPLTITLLDGEEPFLEFVFDDWAAQSSVDASPTAGWGVPQNAIEFGLLNADAKSPATFFVSLASTSVGRGWNSVAYGAGVYRNRMTVRVLSPLP